MKKNISKVWIVPVVLGIAGCVTKFVAVDDADTDAADVATEMDSPVDTGSGDSTPADTAVDEIPENCGNGTVEEDEGEECDDDNDIDHDGCDSDCTWTCEENDECQNGEPCDGFETCNPDEHLCMEGMPLVDGTVVHEADPRLICLSGISVDSVCGDGFTDAGVEECDDGNSTSGDGCSAACRPDHQCLVTLDGGSPVGVSFTSVQPDASLALVTSITVTGTHHPTTTPTFQGAIAACGRNVYAVIGGSSEIQHIDVDLEGNMTVGGRTTLPGVHGLVCDGTTGLVFAYTMPSGALTDMEVVSYQTGVSGSLTMEQLTTLSMGPTTGSTTMRMENGMLLCHPASGELWALGLWRDLMYMDSGLDAARIDFDPTGVMSVVEDPREISGIDYVASFAFSPDAALLLMPGYSGGCFGWFGLDATGDLPVSSDEHHLCSASTTNSKRAAVRSGSEVVYYSISSDSWINIAEITASGSMTMNGGFDTSGNGSHIQLLYDDSVLVTLDPEGGIESYRSDPSGTAIVSADSSSVPIGGFLESSVVVPCTL